MAEPRAEYTTPRALRRERVAVFERRPLSIRNAARAEGAMALLLWLAFVRAALRRGIILADGVRRSGRRSCAPPARSERAAGGASVRARIED